MRNKPPKLPVPIAPLDHPEGFGVLGERYLTALAVQQYSAKTLNKKRAHLKRFAQWCDERSIQQPEHVTRDLCERYQRHIHHYRKANEEPLSIIVQRHHITDIKTFYRWLVDQGYLLFSPVEPIALPKVPKALPKAVLSETEMEALLNQPDINTASGLRDRAMMEMLYSTGLRRGELLDLQLPDIDHARGMLRVNQGKGQKDRIVPVGERALLWLNRYLVDSRPLLIRQLNDSIVFLSRFGNALSPSSITKRFNQYRRDAGIAKPGSVHIFRHTTATVMLEHGADIRHIQALLGHENLSTTQVYTQVAITQLKAVHEKTHPAKLDPKPPADS